MESRGTQSDDAWRSAVTDPAITEAFLADIIAHPADDTPRLIFADYLQEHGDEARAEFIRCQIELAKDVAKWGHQGPYIDCACRQCVLGERERKLLNQHGWQWAGPCATWIGPPRGWPDHFHRGFVDRVELTLAAWRGAECGRCLGTGKLTSVQEGLSGEVHRTSNCPACRGTGRIGGHGPALVQAAPLERVTLAEWQNDDCSACYRGRVRIGLSDNICEVCHGLYDSFACLAWAKGA